MKADALDKIREYQRTAIGLQTFFEKYKKTTSEPSCDKHHAEFNDDNRFTVFKQEIFFSGYTGYYGNSSCSTFNNMINDDAAKEAFVEVLNKNKEKIFAEMAEILNQKAKGLTQEAEQEIQIFNELIEEVKSHAMIAESNKS